MWPRFTHNVSIIFQPHKLVKLVAPALTSTKSRSPPLGEALECGRRLPCSEDHGRACTRTQPSFASRRPYISDVTPVPSSREKSNRLTWGSEMMYESLEASQYVVHDVCPTGPYHARLLRTRVSLRRHGTLSRQHFDCFRGYCFGTSYTLLRIYDLQKT